MKDFVLLKSFMEDFEHLRSFKKRSYIDNFVFLKSFIEDFERLRCFMENFEHLRFVMKDFAILKIFMKDLELLRSTLWFWFFFWKTLNFWDPLWRFVFLRSFMEDIKLLISLFLMPCQSYSLSLVKDEIKICVYNEFLVVVFHEANREKFVFI